MPKTTPKEITVKLNEPKLAPGAKVDVSRAVKLLLKGMSYQEVADVFGCTKSAVHQQVSRYCPEVKDVRVYKDNESEIIALTKSRLLNSLTPQKIEEMSGYQAIGSWGILFDKGRLLSGQSTENVHTLLSTAMELADPDAEFKK